MMDPAQVTVALGRVLHSITTVAQMTLSHGEGMLTCVATRVHGPRKRRVRD